MRFEMERLDTTLFQVVTDVNPLEEVLYLVVSKKKQLLRNLEEDFWIVLGIVIHQGVNHWVEMPYEAIHHFVIDVPCWRLGDKLEQEVSGEKMWIRRNELGQIHHCLPALLIHPIERCNERKDIPRRVKTMFRCLRIPTLPFNTTMMRLRILVAQEQVFCRLGLPSVDVPSLDRHVDTVSWGEILLPLLKVRRLIGLFIRMS